jgi:hypothetical protein
MAREEAALMAGRRAMSQFLWVALTTIQIVFSPIYVRPWM